MDNMGIYKKTISSAGIMGRNPPKAKGTPGRVKSKMNPSMKNRNKVKTKTEAEKKLERLKAANKRNKSITTFKKRKPAKKLAR
jgi:hypothetical protein